MIEKKCKVCGKKFIQTKDWQEYCSTKCQIKRYQQSEKGRLAKKRSDFRYKHSERYKQKLKTKRYRDIVKRYKQSEKGKINRRRYEHTRISLLKARPQYMIKKRIRGLLYNALRKYTKTGKVASSGKYGLNYGKVISYLIKNKPNVPLKELLDGRKWHIDHVVPLAYFDLTNPRDIKKAFAPKNHQWLRARENMSKQDFYKGKLTRKR